MLIVMNSDATATDILRVVETIESLGFKAHPMPGSSRTAFTKARAGRGIYQDY